MIACEVNESFSGAEIRKIVSNYFNYVLKQLFYSDEKKQPSGSIYHFLFGSPSFDPRKLVNIPVVTLQDLTPPLSSAAVRTKLPFGPTFQSTETNTSTESLPIASSVPHPPPSLDSLGTMLETVEEEVAETVRRPGMSRRSRLQGLISRTGYNFALTSSAGVSPSATVLDLHDPLTAQVSRSASKRRIEVRLHHAGGVVGVEDEEDIGVEVGREGLDAGPEIGGGVGEGMGSARMGVTFNLEDEKSRVGSVEAVLSPRPPPPSSAPSRPTVGAVDSAARPASPTRASLIEGDVVVGEEAKPPTAGSGALLRALRNRHLTIHHPSESRNTGGLNAALPTVTRLVPFNSSKPYSNFKNKFVKTAKSVEDEKEEYLGTHTVPYRSPYEQDRAEYVASKEKFVGGSFRGFSGVASALPLRQEGGVRPHGPYDGTVFHDCPNNSANDWKVMRKAPTLLLDYSRDKSATQNASWKERTGKQLPSWLPSFKPALSS
eukprot:gene1620-1885_t